eukprot:9483029-Pyramimonas_sp.AAC.1
MKKLVRWLGTHPLLIQELDRRCDHQHQHEEVSGGGPSGNTGRSQVYTWQLADAICRGLTRVIEPEEFCHGVQICSYYPVSYDKPASHVHQVCYAAPNMEEPPWRAIMSGVVDIMSRRNAGSATVAKDSEMWKQVEELIPWQLLSIQAAFQPKAKRLRPEFGHDVHRCSVLVQEDNQLVIEHEYVPDAYAPRERFQTPVRYALFVIGRAPVGDPVPPRPPVGGESRQPLPVPAPGEPQPEELQPSTVQQRASDDLVRRSASDGGGEARGPDRGADASEPEPPAAARLHS